MRELTGFSIKKVAPVLAKAKPSEAGKRLGFEKEFGISRSIEPLFAVDDATAGEILGTYPDGGTAVAMRRNEQGSSIFVGAPGLTSELLARRLPGGRRAPLYGHRL